MLWGEATLFSEKIRNQGFWKLEFSGFSEDKFHWKPYLSWDNTDQMEAGIQFWAPNLGLSPKYDVVTF